MENKRTKLNAGAVKKGDCMDHVDLAFGANTAIEEFMARVSTQHKQKQKHAKKKTREKKKFSTFFTTVSAITPVQGEEYKNGNVLKINKSEESDRE